MRKTIMSDFIFITASDIHISDTAPRSRIDDFKNTVLGKLSQMATACTKLKADGALIAGDLFNIKTPARNSHALNQDLIQVFKKFPCPIYMIEGNHDLTANRIDSLSQQPLGVLFSDGTLIQLREEIIEKNKDKVSLAGIPYTEFDDLSSIKIPDRKDCKCQICLMHLYSAPNPGMLFSERIYGYKELAKLGPDVFVLGHYHLDQGIEEIQGKYFINIGAMTRGTISDEDVSRQPQIGYIKISIDSEVKIDAGSIKLKVKPSEEIFDLKKREEEIQERKEIEVFVAELIKESIENSDEKEKDFNEILDGMKAAKKVKDKAMYFLQEAAANR